MLNPGTSSGLKTTDTAIIAMPGRLLSVHLITDGLAACTLTIYDNASAASGLVLAKLAVPIGVRYLEAGLPEEGIVANAGIYADVSGAGAEYIVSYTLS